MVPPGLCGACAQARVVRSSRGSAFLLCERARTDPAYPRYPVLPRLHCEGFAPAAANVRPDLPPSAAPPPAGLAIRAATPVDVPVILGFIRQLAEFERLAHEVEATAAALSETLFADRPAAEVVLASLDGRDVGFALFFPTYSTFLAAPGMHLEDLFVVPEARGRGVGRALLVHLARLAEARSYGRLEWAVLSWNAPAIGFYRAVGAFSLDDWQTFRLNREGLRRLAAAGGTSPTQ